MLKRVIAFLIVASLALGSAGCAESSDCSDTLSNALRSGIFALAFVPIGIAMCASAPSTGDTGIYDPDPMGRIRAAADAGDAEAQYALGTMYKNGQSVPRDDAEAAKWYRKAADRGFVRAQLPLAYMYEAGRGVQQDNVEADMWYNVVISAGNTTATKYRDSIEQRMIPDEIAEARKRAQEWKPI